MPTEARVAELERQVGTLQAAEVSLRNQVSNVATALNNLTSSVNALTAQLNRQNTEITALETRIAAVDLQSLNNANAITANARTAATANTRIDGFNDTISSLNTRVSMTGAEVDALETRIEANEPEITIPTGAMGHTEVVTIANFTVPYTLDHDGQVIKLYNGSNADYNYTIMDGDTALSSGTLDIQEVIEVTPGVMGAISVVFTPVNSDAPLGGIIIVE